MARTVNQEEYDRKRSEIIDAAQRLVYSKGYERMTMQDIQDALGISKGAFYHYFDSKPAVLEALIERGQPELEQPLNDIVEDPELTALAKLRRFFDTLDQLRTQQKAIIHSLAHIWFADENAIVREKTDDMIVKRRAPLLNAIARQGVAEGVFTTPCPDQAGVVILAITRGMNNALVRLMLSFEQDGYAAQTVDDIVATGAASSEAIERVLGAPSHTLYRPDPDTVRDWLAALGPQP